MSRLSRRDVLKIGASALAVPLLSRCGSDPAEPEVRGSPRLFARPASTSQEPTPGLSPLGLESGRDGLLYVPTTYTPDSPAPLLVLLHGAGGDADNWVNYHARAEARGMVLLMPDSRDRTWDLLYGVWGPDVTYIDLALAHVFDRCRIDATRIGLGGFSDGASYALSLGLPNGELFTHLVIYSAGFYYQDAVTSPKPRVWISHGTDDPVLPVTQARDVIVPGLEEDGYDVTYTEFAGGHEVPAAIGEAALDWMSGS